MVADVYQPPQFLFQANRTYDYTRTAKANIRENMTGHLMGVLNPTALQEPIRAQLHAAFDCLYDYYAYRGCLEIVGQQRYESLNMLIFYDQGNIKFVAHVTLSSTTIRAGPNQYSVDLALTCQRFSFFHYRWMNLAGFWKPWNVCTRKKTVNLDNRKWTHVLCRKISKNTQD